MTSRTGNIVCLNIRFVKGGRSVMATRNYEGKKFEMDEASITFDSLSIEEPLQININNKPFTMTM